MRNKLTMAMLSVVAVLQAAWVTWTLIPLLPVIVVFVAVVLLVRWSAVRSTASTRDDPRTIARLLTAHAVHRTAQASFVLPFAPIYATELALAPLVKWWEVRKGGSRTSGSGHTCMECWQCSTPDERTIVCSRLVLRAPAI